MAKNVKQANYAALEAAQKRKAEKAQQQKDISLYGNLYFHPLSGAINKRFFYFSSLLNDNYKTPDYAEAAQRIGKAAQSALNRRMLDVSNEITGQTTWEQKYSAIIEFLQKAIDTEKANEKIYFEEKLALFKSTFNPNDIKNSPELNYIQKILTTKGISDYEKYIMNINILLQGLDNTKQLFNYEAERLNALHTGITNMKQNRENQLRGYYKDYNDLSEQEQQIERGLARFERQRVKTYLSQGNLSKLRGSKTNLKNVPVTADVALGQWVTDIVNRIFLSAEYKKRAIAVIKKCGYNKDDANKQLKSILIHSILSYALKNIDDILSGKIQEKNIRQILKELEADIEFNKTINIEGYYDNFGEFGRHIDYFSEGLEHVFDASRTAEDMYTVVLRLQQRLDKYGKKMKDKKEATEIMGYLRGQEQQINLQQRVQELNSFEFQFNRLVQRANKQAGNQSVIDKMRKKGQEHLIVIDKTHELKLGKQTIKIIVNKNGEISLENARAFRDRNNEFIASLFRRGSRAKDIQNFIVSSKKQISQQIKTRLDEILQSKQGEKQKELYDKLEKTLQGLVLSVGGPTLSEIKLGIQSSLISETNSQLVWSGKINLKNDFFEIFNPNIDIEGFTASFRDYENTQMQELIKELYQLLQRQQDEKSQELAKNIQQMMKDAASGKQFFTEVEDKANPGKMKKITYDLRNSKNYARHFSETYLKYLQQETKVNDELETIIEKIINLEADLQKREELAQQLKNKAIDFLNNLQQTLFISSTMKTYNQYQNDIGFLGGSLGANAEAQLNKIYSFFEMAGMPITPAERNWLLFAIINCSPVSVVGTTNQDILENYLGSVAAFLLFDEGGKEISILQNSLVSRTNKNNPNILHLYGLNGIYYPGSLILQQTLDTVLEMQQIIQGTSASKITKNGVSIINKTNYGMIPNSGYYRPGKNEQTKKKNKPAELNNDPWGTVSNLAIANTKIQITFMAGLLDIITKLNNKMNTIEL